MQCVSCNHNCTRFRSLKLSLHCWNNETRIHGTVEQKSQAWRCAFTLTPARTGCCGTVTGAYGSGYCRRLRGMDAGIQWRPHGCRLGICIKQIRNGYIQTNGDAHNSVLYLICCHFVGHNFTEQRHYISDRCCS